MEEEFEDMIMDMEETSAIDDVKEEVVELTASSKE